MTPVEVFFQMYITLQSGDFVKFDILTLSARDAEKPASPTVTNSRKVEILACRSLIYSHKAEMSAWKFWKKTVTNNVVWELRVWGPHAVGARVNVRSCLVFCACRWRTRSDGDMRVMSLAM